MKILSSVIAFCLLVNFGVTAQQTGSWGDQGNGTYKNPILEANYPDNDVIRQGDTYYMMSSTNHFSPGMTILKSKDLVNWEFSNHIMGTPITYDKNFELTDGPNMESRGTWAGSFGYNGEYYFAYWCYNKMHVIPSGTKGRVGMTNVYSKAKSMEGPWSEPKELLWSDGTSINLTDPGVLFDMDTHKAWYVVWGKIYQLSWDGERLLQDRKDGIEVTKEMDGEATKLYKFNDMFYYMNAHWRKHEGVDQRMATFHRAKEIEGPWEGRLVMENGNGTNRCPSQGTLLRLDDDSWWFIHQLARGEAKERYNGRPQMLEPVKWIDGWPLIGVDTDNDGIGEVVWEHTKPIDGYPVTAPATDDDFNSTSLGPQWYWRFNPKADRWSLTERPGFLRLKACVSLPTKDPQSIQRVHNMIGQRVMGRHSNVATAKLDLRGMERGQEGGVHVSAKHNHVVGVRKNSDGNMQLFFKSDTDSDKPIHVKEGPIIKQKEIWLRAQIDNGLATFYYSLNGKTFSQIGDEARLFFSGFTANQIGFYTKNDQEKGHIDIDYFKYDYDGPKSAL